MCNKTHYDELVLKVDALEIGYNELRTDVADMREDMRVSVDRFVLKLDSIETMIKDDAENTEGLVEAWNTGASGARFLKSCGKIAGACTAIGAFVYMVTHWRP